MRFAIIVVGMVVAFAINPNIFTLARETSLGIIIAIAGVFAIWQDMYEYTILKRMEGG